MASAAPQASPPPLDLFYPSFRSALKSQARIQDGTALYVSGLGVAQHGAARSSVSYSQRSSNSVAHHSDAGIRQQTDGDGDEATAIGRPQATETDAVCAFVHVDERYAEFRHAPQQDPHHLQTVWAQLLPHPEEHLLFVWLPRC